MRSQSFSRLALGLVLSLSGPSGAIPLNAATSELIARVAAAQQSSYIYHGCYAEPDSGRALQKVKTDDLMTVQMCEGICAESSYTHFGLEYGKECWCGNYVNPDAKKMEESDCTFECRGNSLQTCGGRKRLNLFQRGGDLTEAKITAPAAAKSAANYAWQGCFTDAGSPRALKKLYGDDALTPERCAQKCAGWSYFGLEYGRECWCGNDLSPNSFRISTAECKKPCAGNPTLMCGAGSRMDLYKKDSEVYKETALPIYTADGCYSNTGANGYALEKLYTDNKMTVVMCASFAAYNSFKVFGLENGNKCWAGNELDSAATAASSCSITCKGDKTQTCGGSSQVQIYRFEEPEEDEVILEPLQLSLNSATLENAEIINNDGVPYVSMSIQPGESASVTFPVDSLPEVPSDQDIVLTLSKGANGVIRRKRQEEYCALQITVGDQLWASFTLSPPWEEISSVTTEPRTGLDGPLKLTTVCPDGVSVAVLIGDILLTSPETAPAPTTVTIEVPFPTVTPTSSSATSLAPTSVVTTTTDTSSASTQPFLVSTSNIPSSDTSVTAPPTTSVVESQTEAIPSTEPFSVSPISEESGPSIPPIPTPSAESSSVLPTSEPPEPSIPPTTTPSAASDPVFSPSVESSDAPSTVVTSAATEETSAASSDSPSTSSDAIETSSESVFTSDAATSEGTSIATPTVSTSEPATSDISTSVETTSAPASVESTSEVTSSVTSTVISEVLSSTVTPDATSAPSPVISTSESTSTTDSETTPTSVLSEAATTEAIASDEPITSVVSSEATTSAAATTVSTDDTVTSDAISSEIVTSVATSALVSTTSITTEPTDEEAATSDDISQAATTSAAVTPESTTSDPLVLETTTSEPDTSEASTTSGEVTSEIESTTTAIPEPTPSDISTSDEATSSIDSSAAVTSEPVTSEPVTSGIVSDVVSATAVTSDPVTSDFATSDAVTSDPVSSTSAPDTATSDTVTSDIASTTPVSSEPVSSDAVSTSDTASESLIPSQTEPPTTTVPAESSSIPISSITSAPLIEEIATITPAAYTSRTCTLEWDYTQDNTCYMSGYPSATVGVIAMATDMPEFVDDERLETCAGICAKRSDCNSWTFDFDTEVCYFYSGSLEENLDDSVEVYSGLVWMDKSCYACGDDL